MDVAQGLSQWLGAFDAVKLNGALHAIEAHQIPARERAQVVDVRALADVCERTRAQLTQLIAPPPSQTGLSRGRGEPAPVDESELLAQANFTTQRQRYQALQKQIEARLDELRALLRQRLARGALALRQLAALDAVLAGMLGEHEQRLWASLPGHLERRFRHWRQVHEQRLAAAGQEDEPQRWRQPGAWLDAFEQDMRTLLLTELQLRLSPITGLLEAAHNANQVQA